MPTQNTIVPFVFLLGFIAVFITLVAVFWDDIEDDE